MGKSLNRGFDIKDICKMYQINLEINCTFKKKRFKVTFQQGHQVVGRALGDICLNMHLTRQSQVPGNACEPLELQRCIWSDAYLACIYV